MVIWAKSIMGNFLQASKINLFSILPASPVEHLQDVAIVAEKAKVLKIHSEAKSQLLEFGSLAQLALLWDYY